MMILQLASPERAQVEQGQDMHLVDREQGRKGGREEGRKGGREEGREEGRKEREKASDRQHGKGKQNRKAISIRRPEIEQQRTYTEGIENSKADKI